MSGHLVQLIGGPLDGHEEHLATYKRKQEILFEAGNWERPDSPRLVHVYFSFGGRAPFNYQGTRVWQANVDVVRRVLP